MNTPKYIRWAFWGMVLYQLILPLRAVYQNETALRNGTVYKFPTVPVDPNDPFRGKYVALDFPDLQDDLPPAALQEVASTAWVGQELFLAIEKDDQGYVKATGIDEEPPNNGDFVAVRVSYISYELTDSARMSTDFNFDRFYLEEFKAPEAEDRYRKAHRDGKDVYAVVRINGDMALLEDVLIDGKSIKD